MPIFVLPTSSRTLKSLEASALQNAISSRMVRFAVLEVDGLLSNCELISSTQMGSTSLRICCSLPGFRRLTTRSISPPSIGLVNVKSSDSCAATH